MKFMTWNVNGIRTLTQYHPYCDDLHKNYKEILDYLGADIICLQETKISRSKLDTDLALVPGYDSYWSFHRTKSGYSGVVIYIKDHIKLLGAEEGISGILSGYIPVPTMASRSLDQDDREGHGEDDDDEYLSGSNNGVGVRWRHLSFEQTVAETMTQFPELDNEGRGLVLDFGFFVLFNLYCPNETDEQRRPFKMAYYHLLEARVRDLIARGKEVIVMGDMNVIPSELDHCDPEKWKKESGESDFGNTEPRRWFNSFLAPSGPLTDLYRVFHKDEKGAFTCWNTKINARPSNYGTRLDYILVTEKLLPWFSSCDRQPQIVGSDHCPVVAEMAAELILDKDEQAAIQESQSSLQQQPPPKEGKRLLKDVLNSFGGTTDHPLAARFFDEFSGKQQKLSAFFKKPASSTGTAPTAAKSATTTTSATFMDNKRPVGSQTDDDDSMPRKKPLFAVSSAPSLPSTPPSPGLGSGSQTRTSTPGSIPKPIIRSNSKPGFATATSKKSATATKPSGQQTMLSFFGTPAKKREPSNNNLSQQRQDSGNGNSASLNLASTPTEVSASLVSIGSSQELLSQPTSTTAAPSLSSSSSSTIATTFSPQDYADWIPGSQEIMPFSINGETTTSKWQTLFTPKTIPKCKFHNQPCTEYTVNKKGPNKGRRFFLCSLPVGPNGDRIGQSPDHRCNYFEWQNPEKRRQ